MFDDLIINQISENGVFSMFSCSALNILSLQYYVSQWVETWTDVWCESASLVLHHLPVRWWQGMQEKYVS